MPKLITVAIVAVLAVGLAALLATLTADRSPRVQDEREPRLTPSLRSPAFYLDLDTPQRLDVVGKCLRKLTSGQANELGAIKDDIALVSDDPAVIGMLLDAYQERAHLSKYEASAFTDLFERIKDPRFVAPVADLLEHEEAHVRLKAAPAARTQADPALTPLLDRVYQQVHQENPGGGAYTRVLLLRAGQQCGGPHFPVLLARGLGDPHSEVRTQATQIIAESGLQVMVRRLEEVLEDPATEVRLSAAWALVRLGSDRAGDLLLDLVAGPDLKSGLFAIDTVRDFPPPGAVARLEELLEREDVEDERRDALALALAALGHEETIRQMVATLEGDGADPAARLCACIGLASTGDHAHDALLRRIVEAATPPTIEGISSGLSRAPGEVDLEVVEAMLDRGLDHPIYVQGAVRRAGDRLLPALTRRLRVSEDSNRTAFLVACIGSIGTSKARDALVACREVHPRLIGEQLRILDLGRRRGGSAR